MADNEKKKTYQMEYKCHNCETSHIENVPFGSSADHNCGTCPYCGETRPSEFSCKKPKGWREYG